MFISRKCLRPLIPSQLCISNTPLERVSVFKYLGIWLSDNLSWSKHIEQITKRAMKQAGMIFRRFYAHSNSQSLKQLYISLVRPHLEYAAPVWDPHCMAHIRTLERIQKCSLRIFKSWNEEYHDLLRLSIVTHQLRGVTWTLD